MYEKQQQAERRARKWGCVLMLLLVMFIWCFDLKFEDDKITEWCVKKRAIMEGTKWKPWGFDADVLTSNQQEKQFMVGFFRILE